MSEFNPGAPGALIHRKATAFGVTSIAIYSPGEDYRYYLRREWEPRKRRVNFLMLNPSTATEHKNDPTLTRCQYLAGFWGYGGFSVTNLFAYRSTDPRGLRPIADPVGEANDAYIVGEVAHSDTALTICAWGVHGKLSGRDQAVLDMLANGDPENHLGCKLHYLKRNRRDGTPAHPLMLGYGLEPKQWRTV